MLEDDYSAKLKRLLEVSPCQIAIPSSLKAALLKKGVVPSTSADQRRFVRHYYTSRAVLELRSSLAAIPRETSTACVIVRNISRGGIAFLHSDQLFPGEVVTVWLPEDKLSYTVTRCVAHNSSCFEIGALTESDAAIPIPFKQLLA